jgi:hypothetical protein
VKYNLSSGVGLLLAAILTMSCHFRSYFLPCKFGDVQDCPQIVIDADAVEVNLFDDHARVTIDKLRDYLSALPTRYWRNGRFVVISVGGLQPPHSEELIRHNKEQTQQIVESLGIEIKCRGRNVTARVPPNKSSGRVKTERRFDEEGKHRPRCELV